MHEENQCLPSECCVWGSVLRAGVCGGSGDGEWTRPVNFPSRPPGCTLPHSLGLLCHALPTTLADQVTVACLSFPICRMGVVLVSRGEGDTECAEEPCRQVVTVSLSVSQPPGSTTPESAFGDTQSTPGTPRGSRWRVHPSGGHRSPGRVPSGGHGPAALRPGPSGSGTHNEGHSHTRPACGTVSQLPVQQPGRCSGHAGGRPLPREYCFRLGVPLCPLPLGRGCVRGPTWLPWVAPREARAPPPPAPGRSAAPGSALLVWGSPAEGAGPPPLPGCPGWGT